MPQLSPVPAVVEKLGVFVAQPLVDEVPDERALSRGIGLDRFPVLAQVAHAVPHGMRVLAKNHGLGGAAVAPHVVHAVVHVALDVGHGVVSLVVHETGGILGVYPVRHDLKGRPLPRLVAQGPEQDRGVVLVPLHHAPHPVHAGFGPDGVAGRKLISHAVGLEVGLADDVEPVLVAELQPARVIRVVRGPDRVDVELLEELDILHHGGLVHGVTQVRVGFVAVDALQHDGATVEHHLAVDELELPEPDPSAFGLQNVTARVSEDQDQRVEVGRLGRPKRWAGYGALLGDFDLPSGSDLDGRGLRTEHDVALVVIQLRLHRDLALLRTVALDVGSDRERPIGVALVQIRHHGEVANVHLGGREQEDFPKDAAQTDHVLVFEPAAVGPAEHLHRDVVRASGHVIGDVELGRGEAVLAVADVLTVHPHVESRLDTLK